MNVRPFAKCSLLILLLACTAMATAGELQYTVQGIADPLKSNVLSHVDAVQIGRKEPRSDEDYAELIATAEKRARAALRPYGYYTPAVKGRIKRSGADSHLLTLDIQVGQPVTVDSLHVELVGEGAQHLAWQAWRDEFPLQAGTILNQVAWEEQKKLALEIATANGFLDAKFTQHVLEVDLERNLAALQLELNTGSQFVFGDIDFGEHALKPGILDQIPRFRRGQPYNIRLLDEFRLDLWKTGYFTSVDVVEIARADSVPPIVDLRVDLETSYKNSYQGSLGVGSDTGMRVQALWTRNPMSRNGDRLDLGFGWQDENDEFSIHSNYRLPRRSRSREYWTLELFQRFENTDLEIKLQPEDEDFINIANGDINEINVRGGRLKIRNRKAGTQQLFTTPFVQYLNSSRAFTPLVTIPAPTGSGSEHFLVGTDNAVSVGIDVDLVAVQGRAWTTRGHRDRLWMFAGDNSVSSSYEFAQFYINSRHMYRMGERWKFLLRGELGYSKAEVDDLEFTAPGGQQAVLSITRLPSFYRFKAGGSQSVRGYGFETLSNNDIGSNNIVTASAEVEFQLLERWSVAAFFDIGNAFNDWDEPELRKGAGLGIRWYSIAGPIRVDVAKALDVEGKPWRLHFTIGTPLL